VASRRGRPTLATVAASAGVSVATVSKVLNGRADVAPATRALVQGLLEAHDYVGRRPDRGAGRTTIELAVDGPLNAYHTEVLQGVLRAAGDACVAVVPTVRAGGRSGGADRPGAWVRELVAAGCQAVIFLTGEVTTADVTALSRARLPLVLVDPHHLPRAPITSIGSTNFTGGLAATNHLLGLGHRRIAFLGGPPEVTASQARMQGYRGAMEAAGATVPAEYVLCRHFRYDDGVAGGAELLALPDPPTAVFAANDEIALGVMEAARIRGLRVPEELSVVGFDDTQLAALSSPPLTTVHQPLREMGAVAVRQALRLAAGEHIESHHVELATELVVRGSTASLPL
jgi:LacI family transcriptional regulator